MTETVCVVIAAMNAETTIGMAVASALSQAETGEVVVVDDASSDGTAAAAEAAANGDPRLRILRQGRNIGPAAARNLAIATSAAPLIAVLDADDVLLPGRFGPLLAEPDWDLIADNILFVPEDRIDLLDRAGEGAQASPTRLVGPAEFIRGNTSKGKVRRGELGFLKPVLRRSFLDHHGLRYDPDLRLGEDYDLYVRTLLAGARFRLSHRPGYAARVRAGSLSGRHRTSDLQALLRAATRHLSMAPQEPEIVAAMRDHHRQLRARYLLRAFLDRKASAGLVAALAMALRPPANLPPIAKGVLSDKLAGLRAGRQPEPTMRYLLTLEN